MKKYNERLIGNTKEFSNKTLQNSMHTVEKLTHPSKKVSYIGSVIGGSVGVGLVVFGTAGLILRNNLIGAGYVLAGVCTVVSNVINVKKNIR